MTPVTSVGIVGGLGPESTVDYYRRILEAWAREDPSTAPSIVIDSLDVQRALRLVDRDRAALVEYLLASLRRLAGGRRIRTSGGVVGGEDAARTLQDVGGEPLAEP